MSTLHHVIDLEWMKEAYRLTRKDGAPGIDGVTAADYAKTWRPTFWTSWSASSQAAIKRRRSGEHTSPRADGSRRPLGLPTFEDKVAQSAIVMVLEANL